MKRWDGLKIESEGTGITAELSQQVNLLGELLGQAIRETLGEKTFRQVEQLRNLCKTAYRPGKHKNRRQAMELISGLKLKEIEAVLRCYTAFFHLINKSEQLEIIRRNREREHVATAEAPRSESIAESIALLKEKGYSLEQVLRVIAALRIEPTLTAHPTEARRRSILHKQQNIAAKLAHLRQGDLTAREREDLLNRIYQQIQLLLATDEVRVERLTVSDEVQQGIYFFSNTIWEVIPQLYADFSSAIQRYYDAAPELPVVLRYRSWIGGDQDGNPFVTPEVNRQTLKTQRLTALNKYIEEMHHLRQELSLSSRLIRVPKKLHNSLKADALDIAIAPEILKLFTNEPYRLKLLYMRERLRELISAETEDRRPQWNYGSCDYIADLQLIRDCLRESGLKELAGNRRLSELTLRARSFGFHIAALDFRQHSAVHEATVDELLRLAGVTPAYHKLSEEQRVTMLEEELQSPRPLIHPGAGVSGQTRSTLETLQLIQETINREPEAIGAYIISMTHDVSDLLEVMLLAREVGLWSYSKGKVKTRLEIVPLLETIDDLQQVTPLMSRIFEHPICHAHLKAHRNFQEIMLGYSDSNKDGGYWMANWALYRAQSELAEVCRKYGITFRMFHGRGGSVGRGGGRANRAILSLPAVSYTGGIRFTEQGEVITFRYALPAIAHRHLEQIANAMLQAAARGTAKPALLMREEKRIIELMDAIAASSMQAYQQLTGNPEFWRWYIDITPIEHISRLPIASRPVSRKSADRVDFESLRAIPWVFAWTQTRYNLPGWYGTGKGLAGAIADPSALGLLQKMYKEWDFFQTVIDNAQLEMRRVHLVTARHYCRLSQRDFHQTIVRDFAAAEKALCLITGQESLLDNAKVLQRSIDLRNPYTDVLNLLQVELLQRWHKAKPARKEELGPALFMSINGVAAAMQSTG